MNTTLSRLFVVTMAALMSSVALAQEAGDVQPPTPAPTAPPPPPGAAPARPAPPEAAAPASIPPPAVAPGVAPAGQWVYTAQYGWAWMPFDKVYTYAPVEVGGDPYMYAYYPAYGWRWLAAPWVFGIGPHPYFGVWGWHHYGWYGHGWYGHPWYGFHRGYPGGYHGIVYSHRGGWGGWGGARVGVHYAAPHTGVHVSVSAHVGHGGHYAHFGHGGHGGRHR